MGLANILWQCVKLALRSTVVWILAMRDIRVGLDFVLDDVFAYHISMPDRVRSDISRPRHLVVCNHTYHGLEGVVFLKYFLDSPERCTVVLRDEYGSRFMVYLYNRHRYRQHLPPLTVHWTHESRANNHTVNKCVESLRQNHVVLIFLRRDKSSKTGVYRIHQQTSCPVVVMTMKTVTRDAVWQFPVVSHRHPRGDHVAVSATDWVPAHDSPDTFNRELFRLLGYSISPSS